MPRDLPIGNGRLLVNFDRQYNLRDVYYPHVGQENHTNGDPCRFGVWADGEFAWTDSDAWVRAFKYERDSLSTQVTLESETLGLRLRCCDVVDFGRDIYFKRVEITNLRATPRDVRVFFHFDCHLYGNNVGDTAFFEPQRRALVHYKIKRYFWLNARRGREFGLDQYAVGNKDIHGAEGTWRDAEDGTLGQNPIAQGSIDSVGSVHCPLEANGLEVVTFWLAAGETFEAVSALDALVKERSPESFINRTADYWRLWVNKEPTDFQDLPGPVINLYKRSLLILRSQINDNGAIIAANDSDQLLFGRDTYCYVWPRDGALVAHALIRSGHSHVARKFFNFCSSVINREGCLLHKYNPDGSLGSSWHPWVGPGGEARLPIQEDETALVLFALWEHYQRFRDVEFVQTLYRPLIKCAADFLARYRDERTYLPAPSHDLWEERRGILSFTTSAVWAGLQAGALFADAFGEADTAIFYRFAAEQIKEAAAEHLYDAKLGRFLRMIQVPADGPIEKDHTLDSSLCGLWQFGMFAPDDPRIVRTMEQVEARLWCKTPVGGMARYEGDWFHRVSDDLDNVPGNPWVICTLWLAEWKVARAATREDFAASRRLLEWAVTHAFPSGVLPEQFNPYTGEPLSVSPLTWSHAAFVSAVQSYMESYRKTGNEALVT